MRIRNCSLFVILFLITFLFSCKNKTTQFFIDYQQEIVLPEGNQIWKIEASDIQTDCQVRFEKNDTKRSKVHQIFLKNITLISDDPSTLQALQLKSIQMECPSISMKKIKFKSVNTVLSDSSIQFQLMESVEDVKEFIKHNQFSVELYLKGNPLKKQTKATLILEFLVQGELIKTILHQRMLV